MSEKRKQILIAQPHAIDRAGLKCLLVSHPNIEIVAEAENGIDLLNHAEHLRPDLIITDFILPKMNAASVTRHIKRKTPEQRVLILGDSDWNEQAVEALESGADGFCPKDASPSELLDAVETTLSGKRYVHPKVADRLVTRKARKPSSPWDALTRREREVLKLIAEGHTNKAIAGYLSISEKTVEKHRSNLMKKLDLHNAAVLTAYAFQKGLVSRKL